MKDQIEEMAKIACTCFDGNCKGCPFDFYPPCPPKASAKRIYNAGYRKQVVAEWEEDTEIYDDDSGEYNMRMVFVCSKCGRVEKQKEPYCNCGAKMKGGAE